MQLHKPVSDIRVSVFILCLQSISQYPSEEKTVISPDNRTWRGVYLYALNDERLLWQWSLGITVIFHFSEKGLSF